jgi:hypothetical protein
MPTPPVNDYAVDDQDFAVVTREVDTRSAGYIFRRRPHELGR